MLLIFLISGVYAITSNIEGEHCYAENEQECTHSIINYTSTYNRNIDSPDLLYSGLNLIVSVVLMVATIYFRIAQQKEIYKVDVSEGKQRHHLNEL